MMKRTYMNNKFRGSNCIQFVHGFEEHFIRAIKSYCNSQYCLGESIKEKAPLGEQGKILILDNAYMQCSVLQNVQLNPL